MLSYGLTWLRTTALYRRFSAEEGQDLAEYALLIGLVAIAVVVAIGTLSDGIGDIFTKIGEALAAIEMPS